MRKKGIGRYKLEVDIEKGCWKLSNRKSVLYLLALTKENSKEKVKDALVRLGWR